MAEEGKMDGKESQFQANSANKATTVILIMLCLSFQAVALGGIALFLPLLRRDLALTFTQCASLSALPTIVYALMQIPSGYLADRYGLKKIFFPGVLGTTILCFIFGLISKYWHAILNQILSGFFRSFLFAAGLALLTSWFSPQRRATAMGLSVVSIFSGYLFMNLVGPSLEEHFNWRYPFIIFAIAGVLSAFAFHLFGRESPNVESKKINLKDVFKLFRYRFMWGCAIIQYVRLGVTSGIAFWLPSFLVDEKGLSLQLTGFIIALRYFLAALSNIMGGYVSDKLKKPTFVIAFSLMVLAITTALIVRVQGMALLMVLIIINSMFIQAYFGPLFSVPVEKYGIHMTGTLTGFGNFFANLGGFSFVYLMGALKDKTGYFHSGFLGSAFACVVAFVFTICLEHMRRGGEDSIEEYSD